MVSYPARLYAAVHTGNRGDVGFYRHVCQGARRVLELGCGTGRVAGRLVEDGLEVTGIDIEEDRLRIAASHGVRTFRANMRSFSLDDRFDRIIAPYNALYCLLDEASLVQCFERVCAHLTRGGRFFFDGYAVDALHHQSSPEDAARKSVEMVASVEVEGRCYDVFEESRWDRGAQRVHATYRHIPRGAGETVEATLSQRYLLAHQLPELLSLGGLELLSLHGNFHGGSFDEASPHLVVSACPRRDRPA